MPPKKKKPAARAKKAAPNKKKTNPKRAAINVLRKKLKSAFDRLEAEDVIAERNFACCTTCASYELDERLEEEKKQLGAVYWHAQNEDDLRANGQVHIGFCARNEDDLLKVGRMLHTALRAEGVKVEWNGTVDEKVLASI